MKTRSLTRTGCTTARAVILSGVALVCFTLSACGINIAPPAADSSSDESPDQTAGDMSMASMDSGGSTMPGDMSTGMGDMLGGDGSSMDPAEMEDTFAMEDEFTNGAFDAEAMEEAMHGAPDGVDPGATGLTPEEMEEMQVGFEQGADGGAADPDAFDPEEMRERMQLQGEAGADVGEFEGEFGAGGGSSRASQFEEGSAPHVVMLMVEAIDAGDMETAADYISDDADGLLGSVRDGEAGENQLNQLQSYFATMDPLSSRPRGRSITLVFNGALDKVLSFDVVREGREFVVDSMSIHDAQTRRRR